MKNEDRLKLLTTITENNEFLDRIQHIRDRFYFPASGFANKKVFQELNAEFSEEPAHTISKAEMEALGIKSIWQARISDQQINETIKHLIERYNLTHSDYTHAALGNFLIYGKFDTENYDPRADWNIESYYDIKKKKWRHYFYFRIHASTRRDSFRQYWEDHEPLIESVKRKLSESESAMMASLNPGEGCVEVYITKHTTKTYIDEHWSEIARLQKQLSNYTKQRPVKVNNYLKVSKDNSIGIKKGTVKTIRRNIKKLTTGLKPKNRE